MSSLLPAVVVPAFIPSPSQGVWYLGPVPLRAYAICILIGIFAGYWLGRKRWVARGGSPEVLADIIMWAVPFGLVGARIYHVVTDYELYFGPGRHPIDALKIWHGGLGIWGAIAFGALGAWIACRRRKVPLALTASIARPRRMPFLAVADAMAPGVALAQVFGRFGNYFNQELFGRPTNHFWGLEIDPAHRPEGYADFATFHPTFLYEAIWSLGVIALIILADRRFKLGHGRAFALYVAGYTAGRAWIENLRIDTVNHFAGLRLNVWTSTVMFVLAVVFLILSARLKPGREDISAGPAAAPPTDGKLASDGEKTGVAGDGSAGDKSSTDKSSADKDVAGEPDDADESRVEATVGATAATGTATTSATQIESPSSDTSTDPAGGRSHGTSAHGTSDGDTPDGDTSDRNTSDRGTSDLGKSAASGADSGRSDTVGPSGSDSGTAPSDTISTSDGPRD